MPACIRACAAARPVRTRKDAASTLAPTELRAQRQHGIATRSMLLQAPRPAPLTRQQEVLWGIGVADSPDARRSHSQVKT
eukprot:366061-Chlamydomonas_euryale.AAC.10